MSTYYKINSIDLIHFKVEYFDLVSKQGCIQYAKDIFDNDRINLFSAKDQRSIAYVVGKQDALLGAKRKDINSSLQPHQGKKVTLIIFVALYAVIFFSSNISGTTLIHLGAINGVDIVAPAAIFIYAWTFLLDSMLTEIYGFSVVRRIYTTVALSALLVIMMLAVLALMPTVNGHNYISSLIFAGADIVRVFFVSLVSFTISEFINTSIVAKLKYISRKKYGIEVHKERRRIMQRFLLATSFGSLVDSILFCFGVFLFILPVKLILVLVVTQYCIKLICDLFACLVSSKLVLYIKRLEKVDIVEMPSSNIVGFKINANKCVNEYQ